MCIYALFGRNNTHKTESQLLFIVAKSLCMAQQQPRNAVMHGRIRRPLRSNYSSITTGRRPTNVIAHTTRRDLMADGVDWIRANVPDECQPPIYPTRSHDPKLRKNLMRRRHRPNGCVLNALLRYTIRLCLWFQGSSVESGPSW